jgi:SET domain-containing protein
MLKEKDLIVKRSGLAGSGKGLFTRKNIRKGTVIAEYKGTVSTWKEADHGDGKNRYIFYINRNRVIDAKPHTRSVARYANDAQGTIKQKGIQNNSEYVENKEKVFIIATKDIPAGSEIFVSYGKEYWDAVKYNLRLDSRKAKKKAIA